MKYLPLRQEGLPGTEAWGLAIHRKVLERIRKGESSIITQQVKDLNKLTLTDMLFTNLEDPLCIEIVEEVGLNQASTLPGSSISSSRIGGY